MIMIHTPWSIAIHEYITSLLIKADQSLMILWISVVSNFSCEINKQHINSHSSSWLQHAINP